MINTFFKFFYCVCVWGEKPFFFLDKRAIIPPSLFSKRYLKPWSHLNHLQVRLYLVPTILRNYPHTLSQLSGGFSKPTETHQAVAPAYSRSGTWEIHTYFLPPPSYLMCESPLHSGRYPTVVSMWCPPWPDERSKVKLQKSQRSFSHLLLDRKIINASL